MKRGTGARSIDVQLARGLGLLLVWASAACQREPAPVETRVTPDRLAPGERLPESETAFGLPMPPGMRLVRHFKDAAYFAGDVKLQPALEHVAKHVAPASPELVTNGAVFARVAVNGGAAGAPPLRITLKQTQRGSQIHIEQLTPPPPVASGLSQEEIWRKAGRNKDGTPLDQNQLY
jgi:hypothetical protein